MSSTGSSKWLSIFVDPCPGKCFAQGMMSSLIKPLIIAEPNRSTSFGIVT